MALCIRNPETEALARDVARIMGTSITKAITESLREHAKALAPLRQAQSKARLTREAALDRIVAKFGRSLVDRRSAEDIIGYDEHGLPQ